jgi:hypothetical protein
MSHLDEFKTQFKNIEAFVRALCRMGFERNQIEVNEKAKVIMGYHRAEDGKVGHVIIRQPHTMIPSDIGWEMKDGVLVSHVDQFDYNRVNQKTGQRVVYNAAFNVKLTEFYNLELTKMTYEARGLTVVECRDSKNRLQLKAKLAKAAVKARIRL